jgi:predicted metal-dependent hydrolase
MILKAGRRVTKIELKPGQPILVKGNLRMNQRLAENFLREKWTWVAEKYHWAQELVPSKEEILSAGSKHLYLGHELVLEHSITPLRSAFLATDSALGGEKPRLILYLPQGCDYLSLDPRRLLRDFYNKEARRILAPRMQAWASQMNLQPRKVSFKMMKSRWGSCSSVHKISINSHLIKAPVWVSDSVLVHELAHLKHLNHSDLFWNLVEQYAPEHKRADLWLKSFIKNF